MKKAFTFMEMLIAMGIVVVIAGGVIIAMTRGASNVHRGSFNAVAANQAAWIVSLMRGDIARSNYDVKPEYNRIFFVPEIGNVWKGTTEFKVQTHGGRFVNYAVETLATGKVFVRTASDGRKQRFAAEYLTDLSVELVDGSMVVDMLFKDPASLAVDYKWSARIYPPTLAGPDRFWKPLTP
ncbi:MAG: prepilin-type N-terminal cleavage/methylation domain-containing protein [Candidatus Riflebacteria bacterium]|nr:prepilin-type N-terminal cleavage/methylation domain-containing protein [Candidatus Riflebacteria bacterium]